MPARASDFAVAEVMVWNRGLTALEITDASDYLMQNVLGLNPPPRAPPPSPSAPAGRKRAVWWCGGYAFGAWGRAEREVGVNVAPECGWLALLPCNGCVGWGIRVERWNNNVCEVRCRALQSVHAHDKPRRERPGRHAPVTAVRSREPVPREARVRPVRPDRAGPAGRRVHG
eukprot:4920485-Prymnesium_polylepis.1